MRPMPLPYFLMGVMINGLEGHTDFVAGKFYSTCLCRSKVGGRFDKRAVRFLNHKKE